MIKEYFHKIWILWALPEIGDRIRDIRKAARLSRERFAEVLAERPSKIQDVESGRQRVNDEFISKLVSAFPVDLNWLFGQSPRRSDFKTVGGIAVTPPRIDLPLAGHFRSDGEEFSMIRRYDVLASAGPGRLAESEDVAGQIAFSRRWLRQLGLAADLCGLIHADGDSMQPLIPSGALLLVDFRPETVARGIYVIRLRDDILLKRLSAAETDPAGRPSRIVMSSENPQYPDRIVSGGELGDLHIIGRVVWWSMTVNG